MEARGKASQKKRWVSELKINIQGHWWKHHGRAVGKPRRSLSRHMIVIRWQISAFLPLPVEKGKQPTMLYRSLQIRLNIRWSQSKFKMWPPSAPARVAEPPLYTDQNQPEAFKMVQKIQELLCNNLMDHPLGVTNTKLSKMISLTKAQIFLHRIKSNHQKIMAPKALATSWQRFQRRRWIYWRILRPSTKLKLCLRVTVREVRITLVITPYKWYHLSAKVETT